MLCANCRQEIEENIHFCPYCGAAAAAPLNDPQQEQTPPPAAAVYQQWQTPPRPLINSTVYMVSAIITAVLCFLPLGIPAIVYAGKIKTALALGDYASARQAANKSRLFSILAACVCVLLIIAMCVIMYAILAAVSRVLVF